VPLTVNHEDDSRATQKEGKSVKVTFIGGPEMALVTGEPANKKKEHQKQKSDPTLTDEQSTIPLEREISRRDGSAISRRKISIRPALPGQVANKTRQKTNRSVNMGRSLRPQLNPHRIESALIPAMLSSVNFLVLAGYTFENRVLSGQVKPLANPFHDHRGIYANFP
jgi:hypothetical protein